MRKSDIDDEDGLVHDNVESLGQALGEPDVSELGPDDCDEDYEIPSPKPHRFCPKGTCPICSGRLSRDGKNCPDCQLQAQFNEDNRLADDDERLINEDSNASPTSRPPSACDAAGRGIKP